MTAEECLKIRGTIFTLFSLSLFIFILCNARSQLSFLDGHELRRDEIRIFFGSLDIRSVYYFAKCYAASIESRNFSLYTEFLFLTLDVDIYILMLRQSHK